MQLITTHYLILQKIFNDKLGTREMDIKPLMTNSESVRWALDV